MHFGEPVFFFKIGKVQTTSITSENERRANLPGSVPRETSDGEAESGASGPRVGSIRHGIVAGTRTASELHGDTLALHIHAIYAK